MTEKEANTTESKSLKILLYGYGNPGRQDDGLGVELINRIEPWIQTKGLHEVYADSNYQLNIEDADAIADKDLVIFADASVEDIDDFIFTKVEPSDAHVEFTMHSVSSAFVLDLCKKLYNRHPEVYLLHIRGYEWDFKEGLTEKATGNLMKALEKVKQIIENPSILKNIVQIN